MADIAQAKVLFRDRMPATWEAFDKHGRVGG